MTISLRLLRANSLLCRARERLKRRVKRALSGFPDTTIRLDPQITNPQDAIIRRKGGGFEVNFSANDPWAILARGPARVRSSVYFLANSSNSVKYISVTLSDGELPSTAIFSPSTFLPDVVAVPDTFFYESKGYAQDRTASLQHYVPWQERSADLVWRGGTNSLLSFDPDMAKVHPDLCSQRLLACLRLRNVPDTDVKFAGVTPQIINGSDLERLGIVGEPIEQTSWLSRKFALDIDGYSNAWQNLLTRLMFGCCVLKITSRHGFRQWYYDRLHPWEHYIPVAADLSDLEERLDWARSNDAESKRIAERGRQLAMEITLDAATKEAAQLIEANWQRVRA
jgi:hypothetical protein